MPPPLPNPPVDVAALLAPVSADTVKGVILGALVSMKIRADRWPKEGVAISLVSAVAALYAGALNATIIPAIGAGWLPSAARGWLRWLAVYMYGVTPTAATFATGEVTLANALGGSFAFDPGEVTFQNATTKATYVNTEAIALGPGPGSVQTVAIQATAQGSAGNAGPGDITVLVTTLLGVTVTNAADVVGIDEQSDEALRALCWNAIAANSPFGPRQSIAYAIQTATLIGTSTPVNVNRWQIAGDPPDGLHAGALAVYLASPSGPAESPDVDGVAANIQAIARPPGVTVAVAPAVPVTVADTLTIYVTATPGLDVATVQAAMSAALEALFASYPIGGKTAGVLRGIFASAIEAACFAAWPGVFDVVGAFDHALAEGEVATDAVGLLVRIV